MRSHQKARRADHPAWRVLAATFLARAWSVVIGVARLYTPQARGVFHPRDDSPIVLGVALTERADVDALAQQLWWRGLGLVERNGQVIAGADITLAVQRRRAKHARLFVTRQLRDAGVRGPVKRWENEARARHR